MRSISSRMFVLLCGICLLTACEKDPPVVDNSIHVDAGTSQVVIFPGTSSSLSGYVKSGDTTKAAYVWALVSGPNTPTIANKNSPSTAVTNMVAGSYIFKFQVTNSFGKSDADTATIVVFGNDDIIVDAGATQTAQSPADTVTLSGTVKSGITPNTSYLWLQVSGPNTATIKNNNTTTATITNLAAGTYVFQFQATTNQNETGIDTTSVIVLPGQRTLTVQPSRNVTEGFVDNFYPGLFNNGDTQLDMAAWTGGGLSITQRTFIKFDLSSVPANSTVDSAKLYLYAMPNPHGGNMVDAQYGSSNACYVNRITSSWSSPNIFSWSNQPVYTAANRVVIP